MKNYIEIEGRTVEGVIKLNELNRSELENMIEIALEFENYEMCTHLKKYIDLLN